MREEPIDRKRCFHFLIKWPPDIFHPLHTSFICKKPGCMYLKFLQLRNSTRVAAYHYLKSKSPLGLHTFNWQISPSQQKQQNICFNKHSRRNVLSGHLVADSTRKTFKRGRSFFIFARHHLALEGNSQYIGAGGEQF